MDALATLFGVPQDYWSNRATTGVANSMISRLNEFKDPAHPPRSCTSNSSPAPRG
ncbi:MULTISPECIES: hypothetical protein [Streptomyces]|uniref:hypothetical protein n=1 Tax=Streptomyces TaxID=1883 RepID=UPI0019657FD6|nr:MULTISPECIES: hypothetical protein [Streptomyces]QRX90821.1 hypothetical protein JNO44_08255 [Streptomyces noursei]